MSERQKLSVITVCFNSQKTIARTLQSLKDQTDQRFQSIVIDGGSTDGTVEIVKSFGDLVSAFISERDGGIYDAMNKGIGLMSGSYVAFLNSDDRYFPNSVADVLTFAERQNPGIIYGNMLKTRELNGEILSRLEKPNLAQMPDAMGVFHPSTFIRRDMIEKYGSFDTRFSLAADYHWLLRAYLGGADFQYLDKTLVEFSIGGVSNFSCKSYLESAEIQHELNTGTHHKMISLYKLCKRKKLRNKMIQGLMHLKWFRKFYENRIRKRWS